MAYASRVGPEFQKFLQGLTALLVVAVVLGAGTRSAFAGTMAVIDSRLPVQDITDSLMPILAPVPTDADGHIQAPVPRTLAFETAFSGWASLTVHNPGPDAVQRVLVFSYPALARSGLFGAPFANPALTDVRAVDGDLPTEIAASRIDNRFAALAIKLDPGSTRTFAFLFKNGGAAAAVRAWDPNSLARFNTLLLLAVGLFWGILFVAIALMFAMRLLSSGQGLFSGGLLALAALVFEGASFGFGGAPWSGLVGQIGFDAAGLVRCIALTLVGFFGLQFLRSVLALRDEAPLTDIIVRLMQYALLIAVPLIFWPGIGAFAPRIAAAIALAVSGLTMWGARRSLPDALRLIPPGWTFLVLAGWGALAVAAFRFTSGGPVVELLLHGLFIIGVMLLIFSAAVRTTIHGGIIEYEAALQVPAFARGAPALPAPAGLPVPIDVRAEPSDAYQGLWDWNIAEGRLYVSPSVEAMMGLPEGALQGKEELWAQRILEADRATYAETLQHYIHQGSSSFAVEFRVRHDGGIRWLQLRATGIDGGDGQASRIVGVVTDITAAKTAEEKLVREITHDALTGVGNRTCLITNLDWALAAFRSHPVVDPRSGDVLAPALIILDIDRFKRVNDELGTAAGDQMLTEIARRIEQAIRPHDVLARIGSDEFAVLLTPADGAGGAPAMEDPSDVVALLGDLFAQPMKLAGHTVYPSATVVFVRIDEHHRQAQAVLADAELALRRAKKGGADNRPDAPEEARPPKRDKLKPSAPAALVSDLRQLESNMKSNLAASPLEDDLRLAVQRDQVKVAFQPIVAFKDRSLVGFEALLRWQHPERGAVSPQEFIPVAEKTGLIITLGRFALSMAALQLAQWQSTYARKRPLFVAVNVSSRQLLGEEFARDIQEVLSSVRLAPGSLKLEITESLVFDDEEHVAGLLEIIKSKGVSIALDDYGQGHSNLNRLKSLPISTVKIDAAFVAGAGDNGQADAILRSTIQMAHDMGLDVVAEGVETELQARTLAKFGCDFAQGHFYGSPMSVQQTQRFIARAAGQNPRLPKPVKPSPASGSAA